MMEEEAKVDFIPCLTWVKRGVPGSTKLKKVNPTKQELEEIMKEMKLREAEHNSRTSTSSNPKDEGEDDDEDKAVDDFYDMDNYDDDEEDGVAPPGLSADLNSMLTQSGGEDNDGSDQDDNESLDSDQELGEFELKEDDNLILCGHVDGDVCMLEVYVFNNEKAELFIWNDTFLPSYPLCIEWINFNPKNTGERGNFAAVGNITPEIQVWDLTLSGSLEPAFSLGSKKKKGMKHRDAVLDLSWHKDNRSIMASGSADQTVMLWDMGKSEGLTRIDSFEEKVQSLKFHPFEVQSLLTGCCDGKARLYDCRNPKYFKTWAFDGEIERVCWNEFDPFYFFTTTDNGMVYYVDSRTTKPVWTLKAHDKEVTGVCLSSYCKDLLMTSSMDQAVKVWDLQGGTPTFVAEKNMDIGQIYALSACPDVPYVFCAGGNKKHNYLYVWDSRENGQVLDRFKGRKFEEVTIQSQQDMELDGGNTPQPSTSQGGSRTDGKFTIRDNRPTDSEQLVRAVNSSNSNKKKKKKTKKPHKDMHPKSK